MGDSHAVREDSAARTGFDWKRRFQVKIDGVAQSLSGATITAQIRTDAPKSTPGSSLVTALTVTLVDSPNGIFDVECDQAVTATLTPGRVYWYLVYISASWTSSQDELVYYGKLKMES